MTPAFQLPLDLGFRPAMGGGDFLVAPANAEAVAWLDRWPDWPAPALTIFGPPGCGKTHLAQVWRARNGARTIAGRTLAAADLPELLVPAKALVVDDAQEVAGQPAGEEALFHLFNRARDAGGHLLLLAEAAPAHWPLRLADLASRLKGAPAVGVAAPDEPLLAAVLVKLFADRQLVPGPDVIAYLLVHMERSLDAARRTVAAIDRASLARRRAVTVPLVRDVLNAPPEPPESPS